MEIYQKIKKILMEEKFKIELSEHYIHIVNYTKIRKIEPKEMVVETSSSVVRIIGSSMSIQKLLEDEVLITGNIHHIDLGSDTVA